MIMFGVIAARVWDDSWAMVRRWERESAWERMFTRHMNGREENEGLFVAMMKESTLAVVIVVEFLGVRTARLEPGKGQR